jgi:ribosomal protein L4
VTEQDAYHELCAYTLSRRDLTFIHQHVVDTFAAQHANAQTKPIGLTFALVGLYLHNEKQFSGRDVQRAHMKLAQRKQPWPELILPVDRGTLTVVDVIAAPEGELRDAAIHAWCAAVWDAFRENEPRVADLLRRNGIA